MEAAKVDYQMIVYGGAKHSFTNPGADRFGIPGIAYDRKADQRSWEAMTTLFRETIGPRKGAPA
jgi:dienelactone hydrolase